ncbi:MAG: RNA polymerase sigma factor [Polyangiaceae bacterium]
MNPKHPPQSQPESESDQVLALRARNGELDALEALLERQQPWIFNLAFYMLHHRQDAEDATQEILVKIATGLAGFQGKSSLRTWIRRIAVNHVLDFRRSRPEQVVTGFGCYAKYLDCAADADLDLELAGPTERRFLVDEARISCTLGMLLCLDRSQRIVFLLGEILETSDAIAAELLDVTKENFRQKLARAREQLSSFMQGRCGLVNPQNSCRCARKTAAFIRDKIVDPNRLQFARGHITAIATVVGERDANLRGLLEKTRAELRMLYPLYEAPAVVSKLRTLLSSKELRTDLNLA